MKKYFILSLVILLGLGVLSGCGGGGGSSGGGSDDGGTINVNVGYPQDQKQISDIVVNYYLIDIYRADAATSVDGEIPTGNPLVPTTRIDYPDTSAVIEEIPVGPVVVVVIGYEDENTPVLQGTGAGTVTTTDSPIVEISLSPYQSPTPTPTVTVTPTSTPTSTPTATPTVSPTPTPTLSPTPTPTPTPDTYTILTSVPYAKEDPAISSSSSYHTIVSDDGQRVTFTSYQSLVADHKAKSSYNSHIYLFDNEKQTLQLIDRAPDGKVADKCSLNSYISGNGKYIVYHSYATNLLGTAMDNNGKIDIFMYDIENNVTGRISTNHNYPNKGANGDSENACVNYDGTFVAYQSKAMDLIDFYTSPGYSNVYRSQVIRGKDKAPATTNTILVSADCNSVTPPTEGNENSKNARISRNGNYVVFVSGARNLDMSYQQSPNKTAIYLTNCTYSYGAPDRTRLISREGSTIADGNCDTPHMSDDPIMIVFSTASTNLGGNGSGITDVYYWNNFEITLVSQYLGGTLGSSGNPTISSDGNYAAFESDMSGLVSNDYNSSKDIFVKNISTGTYTRVSVDSEGNEAWASSGSYRPFISGNTQYVAFESYAFNLAPMPSWGTGEIVDGVMHTYLRKWLK